MQKGKEARKCTIKPERYCVIQYSNTAGYAKRVIKTAFGCVPMIYGRLPKLTVFCCLLACITVLIVLGVLFFGFGFCRGGILNVFVLIGTFESLWIINLFRCVILVKEIKIIFLPFSLQFFPLLCASLSSLYIGVASLFSASEPNCHFLNIF